MIVGSEDTLTPPSVGRDLQRGIPGAGLAVIDEDEGMDLELAGKTALITGASRGLGLASAKALVGEGCSVCITARGEERLRHAERELRGAARGGAAVHAVQADLTTAAGVEAAVSQTVGAFGRLDILVNNLGLARGGGIVDATDAEWREAIDFTLFPAIRASRLAVPHMRQGGGGVIIVIASIWGRESGGRMTYNAVKAATISLAKSMAQQLAPYGIRVNSVAPGSILFPGGSWHQKQQADPEGIADFIRRELPFGRLGRAEEVGDVVAFLASARASWVSGASVTVDGCQSRSLI